MNIESLKLFCDVIRLQSFSLGAKASSVSQSAASQAIQQLEEHLGINLIDRTTRPFTITAAGERFYDGLKPILSDYENLEAEIKSATADVSGELRIAAIYSVGLYDLSRHMADFARQYPEVEPKLVYLRPNQVYDAVVNGEADIGILSYPKSDRRVFALPWRSEKMVFVCHPAHRLTNHAIIAPADLSGEKFIAFDADLPIQKAIRRALKQNQAYVDIVMQFDNIDTMKQAIEINTGVSILPEPTIRREAAERRVVAIPLTFDLVRSVGFIHSRNKPLSPALQRLIELLREAESPTPLAKPA